MVPVVAHPETIEKSRAESMVFFEGGNLPFGNRLLQDVVEYVRLSQRRVIVHIRPEEAVFLRNFFINSGGVIIFADDLLPWKHILPHICIGRGTRWIEKRQILPDLVINA